MKNSIIKPLIERIKNGDMSAFPAVYDEFKKLITFFAVKLHYEDASADLILFFVELICNMDLSRFSDEDGFDLKKYIVASIKNKYVSIMSQRIREAAFNNELYEGYATVTEKVTDRICLRNGFKSLPEVEKSIILYRYYYGYSIAEIAEEMNITRQSVNKRKNKALKIMRKAFEEETGE